MYRSKGMTSSGTFKLMSIELFLATSIALVWGLINAVLYSSSIFDLSYPQQLIQIPNSLNESTILIIIFSIIISFILLLFSTIKVLRYKMIFLLKRSL